MDKKERKAALINHQKLWEGMDQAGLDVLVASLPKNTFYLSGCFNQAQAVGISPRLHLVVWPREGPETYIVCNVDEPLSRLVGWIEDVRSYVRFVTSPIEVLVEVLAEKGLSRGRVGIEVKHLPIVHYRELVQRLPGATLVPADAILGRARAIKTPAEIERLQKAAVLTEEAVYTAWKRSHPWDTERDVYKRMIEELKKRGSDHRLDISIGAGENTLIVHHKASFKRLEPGDLLLADNVGFWDHFWSDIARMGVVGGPSQRQRELYRMLWEVQRATIARMRPGVEVRELYNFPHEIYTKRGVDFILPHLGHSMPQTRGHEDPKIQPFEATPLEPNMLLAVEHRIGVGSEHYHLEDLVLVTESGTRLLSNWWNTEELFVIE
jgi:Xaa-Pro aminopeptidase